MLALCVFVASSLTIVYVEVISNIKYYLSTRGKGYYVYIDDISNNKFQLHHLYLEHYFIQQKHDQKIDIYVSTTIPNINN